LRRITSIDQRVGPECVTEAGLPEGFRFHDLRHIGTTLAASSGASSRGVNGK
jgi:integrase